MSSGSPIYGYSRHVDACPTMLEPINQRRSGSARAKTEASSALPMAYSRRQLLANAALAASRRQISGMTTPPPPAEKTAARQDQAWQPSTDDRSRHVSYGVYQDRPGKMSSGAI